MNSWRIRAETARSPARIDRVNAAEAQNTGHHQTRWTPPLGSSTVTLLRHGATEGYTPGMPFPLADGHGDPGLAELGFAQAADAGRRLAREHRDASPIAAVYVTSLRRTMQTAAPLLAAIGSTPLVERELREVFLGEWEGGEFRQRIADADPLAVAAMQHGEWGHVPGAETSADLALRCMAALGRIADRHVDERVVCVVHGGVIAAIVSSITGSNQNHFLGADNCSLTSAVRTPMGWRIRSFNDTSHLDGGW